MKNVKKICLILVIASLCLGLVSCAKTDKENEKKGSYAVYKDSLGRNVKLPNKIKRYVVTGLVSFIPCFAVEPDKLVAMPSKWSDDAKDLLDKKYLDLPVIGQLFGGKSELDKETLISLKPDVIIDMGERKDGIKEDLDDITKQTGIPSVFIDMDFKTPKKTFEQLNILFDQDIDVKEVSEFTQNIVSRSNDLLNDVSQKKKILYCLGDNGCNVIAKDSYHSTIIDMVGDNLAVIDNPSSKGLGNEVDFEQILKWDPEYIIFGANSIAKEVSNDEKWKNLNAIKNNNYIEVPEYIYNSMGFPPSMQRYLGLMFLESRLYPEKCNYDLGKEIKKFYKLFLHYDVDLSKIAIQD